MRSKAKVIKLTIMLIVTAITFIMVTFAWFIAIDKTDPIIIESGTLRVNANLYIWKDNNQDGLIQESEYVEVTDEINNLTNVLPGSVYYFKLTMENEGSVPGQLTVDIINIEYSDEIMHNAFKIDFLDPVANEETEKYIVGEDLNVFRDYVVGKESIFLFYFKIVGDESISSDMAGEYLRLTSFLVTLNQIKPS